MVATCMPLTTFVVGWYVHILIFLVQSYSHGLAHRNASFVDQNVVLNVIQNISFFPVFRVHLNASIKAKCFHGMGSQLEWNGMDKLHKI